MENIDDWPDLIARQHGIVSVPQLREHGVTASAIRANVRAARWTGSHTGVYATFTGPFSPDARRWAAVLACSPCALSHGTAAVVLGLRPPGDDHDTVHLTRPYGLSAVRADGVAVHRSRAFAHLVVPGSEPPVVSRPHTVVDLAVAEPTPRAAMAVLLHLLVTTNVSPDDVRTAMELRRPPRWRRALLAALEYAEGGVTSVLEARWALDVERAHGLPGPTRQFPVPVDGRGRDEDLVYVHDGVEVVVRLDGRRFHAAQAVNLVDRRRANAAELAGRRHLVYGWPEITETPCLAARELAAVLRCDYVACERCRSS